MLILTSSEYSEAQVTVRKHPVSIALSNRVLEKIDREASKQKRSRSKWAELHFEIMFIYPTEIEAKLYLKKELDFKEVSVH